MKVAVVGGLGFIGSAVVRAAGRGGHEAIAFTRPEGADGSARTASMLEAIVRAVPDVVVHAASPSSANRLTVQMAEERQLLSALAAFGAPAVVIGSAAVLSRSIPDRDGKFSEAAAPLPSNRYGLFKLRQEACILDLRAAGWRVSIARLFNPVGRGMKAYLMLGRLVREIAAREADPALPARIEMGPLSAVRDFTHVDDAADAVIRIVELALLPALVHVATGIGMTARELARLAIAASMRPALELTETVEAPGDPAAVSHVVGDAALLQRLTGWQPARAVAAAVQDALAGERQGIHGSAGRHEALPASPGTS